jgi:membrane protein required for colicin V production
MNTLDIIVIVVLLLSAGFAYTRGLVREVLSIVAWFGAAAIGFLGYRHLAPFMKFLPDGTIREIAAGAAIFVVALIILSIITGAIAHRVSQSGLSSVDRVFGLLFGLARGAVLLCLGYIALMWYLPHDQPQPNWVAQARSKWFLERGANAIEGLAPQILSPPQNKKAAASHASNRVTTDSVESAMRALISPPLTKKPRPDAPTYNHSERNGLDRLIDQHQGQQ